MRFVKIFLLVITLNSLLSLNFAASDAVVLVTTDIHGNVNSGEGGFLRLSTAINNEKEKVGKENTILIDCGDTLQGSFEAALTRGAISIYLLNELGYNFWIPGNHDFDYGYDIFLDRVKEFRGKTLCSNIVLSSESKSKLPYVNWALVKKNNIKIAIIGATFPDINISTVTSSDVSFRTIALNLALKAIMPQILKENTDVIVLAVHGGLFNKNWFISKEIKKYPQIDLVLGGHTHEAVSGKTLYNGSYYFQAGHGGEYLGKVEITMNKGKGRPDVVSTLIPVANYQCDKQLEARLSKTFNSIKESGDKLIAFIKPDEAQNNGVLVSKAMIAATKADVAIFGLTENNNKLSGAVNVKNIYDLIPYEDNVSLIEITRDELNEILQEMCKYMENNKKYKKISVYGFDFEVSKKRKVLNLALPSHLESKKRILLAISSYYIDYPTNKFPAIRKIAEKAEAKYKNTNQTIRDAFKEYLLVKFPVKN